MLELLCGFVQHNQHYNLYKHFFALPQEKDCNVPT